MLCFDYGVAIQVLCAKGVPSADAVRRRREITKPPRIATFKIVGHAMASGSLVIPSKIGLVHIIQFHLRLNSCGAPP
jgi:hypothetical protein